MRSLVAVQSQEFAQARWSLGQRASGLAEAAVNEAYDRGTILRTHVLRPTWHFVLPDDIRWLLELTGPRVIRIMSTYDRRLGLDVEIIERSRRLMTKALEREGALTRQELRAVLNGNGVDVEGQSLNHVVMNAELRLAICSGGLRGKQHTYALLEERAPDARRLSRDEALGELTTRYLAGHGPATVKDFRWWSGLTAGDVKRGIEIAGAALASETIDGVAYWFVAGQRAPRTPAAEARFLQTYDEYVVGYTESRMMMDGARLARTVLPTLAERWTGVVLIGDQVAGHYLRTASRGHTVIAITPYRGLTAGEREALAREGERWARFHETPVSVQVRRRARLDRR